MRRDEVPSEAEIAADVDRLLADADEGAPPVIDTWPPLNAGDRAVDYAKRAADMVITAPMPLADVERDASAVRSGNLEPTAPVAHDAGGGVMDDENEWPSGKARRVYRRLYREYPEDVTMLREAEDDAAWSEEEFRLCLENILGWGPARVDALVLEVLA